MTLKPTKFYQHRYGGLYQLVDISTSTVDKSSWVVYKHIYPFEADKLWHRPLEEFTDGRFRLLSNLEVFAIGEKDQLEFQQEITANKEAAKSKG